MNKDYSMSEVLLSHRARKGAKCHFLFGVCLTIFSQICTARAEDDRLSDTLPSYFSLYLTFSGVNAAQTDHHKENGGDVYIYTTPDQRTSVRIDKYSCEVNVCSTLLDNAFRAEYQQVAANGEYLLVSQTDVYARWSIGENEVRRYAFVMPGQLLLWTVALTAPAANSIVEAYQDGLVDAVNRARFELAEARGELPFGRMDNASRAYAEALLKGGQKQNAVSVLKEVITTTPQDYKAQIEFARNTNDVIAARASAKVVLENAESPDLIAAAEDIIGTKNKDQTLPPISKNEGGLQVILIPLQPCDLQLVKDASAVYTQITSLPVQIRSLPDAWDWGPFDRMPNQRAIQQIIVQNEGTNIDFSSWTLLQYEQELEKLGAKADPITRYRVKTILNAADSQGQYSLNTRLGVFSSALSKYKSPDQRTVYVGVTSANVAVGDANFNFWAYYGQPGQKVGLLSYYMMTAGQSGQSTESRSRLSQRIAKQLVGLSLNILGIPAANDPRDPSSLADNIQRVDEMGLTLSQPTADALAKVKQNN